MSSITQNYPINQCHRSFYSRCCAYQKSQVLFCRSSEITIGNPTFHGPGASLKYMWSRILILFSCSYARASPCHFLFLPVVLDVLWYDPLLFPDLRRSPWPSPECQATWQRKCRFKKNKSFCLYVTFGHQPRHLISATTFVLRTVIDSARVSLLMLFMSGF